ncbi:MAG TPA: GNAT family N-acetyltransferase [Acidimicrobiales bacterium]|nr:GNAT family N-acetyltransferase [Acidimicrobiales bacterium]
MEPDPVDVVVRDATPEDWAAIYPIFAAIVDEGHTYAYPEGLDSDAARALWVDGPPGRCVVATLDATVVGTAKMGPNRPGRGAHVATASVMVADAARGRGVGRALGRDLVDWAFDEGYRGIQFNAVVSTNVAAVALWRELGFDVVGTVPRGFEHRELGFVDLYVMYRPLG